MSAQRLGPRWLRRLSRVTGETVVIGWSHGGYTLGFATEHHRHGGYDQKTGEVVWDVDCGRFPYASCSSEFWPEHLRRQRV
jgi:hypothetical protein